MLNLTRKPLPNLVQKLKMEATPLSGKLIMYLFCIALQLTTSLAMRLINILYSENNACSNSTLNSIYYAIFSTHNTFILFYDCQ